MHRELVERRRWLSDESFLHALNFCVLLPSPEAQQLAIYIGWLLHRVPGDSSRESASSSHRSSCCSRSLISMPPYGYTAAAVGVIFNRALDFGAAVVWPHGFRLAPDWFALALTLLAFLALYRFKLDVLWVVLAGGLVGLTRALME